MNALSFVLRQWARRPLPTALSVLVLAVAIGLLLFVVQLNAQIVRQMTRDAQGVDLVVGAKGSPLQLVLSAVYHADMPTGNVPAATLEQLRAQRLVAAALPISLGDNLRGFRIVGSQPELIDWYGARLSDGAPWRTKMEAVLGAEVAKATGLGVGSRFFGAHGLAADGPVHAEAEYLVTGVLARSGTVLDRLVLTDLASVWHVHEGEAQDEAERRILEADRQITAVLVRYASPLAAALLPRQLNAQPNLLAAAPAVEVARLFTVLGVGFDTLRAIGAVLLATALLALFAGLTQALEERRYDLAILRLLGASRARVAGLLALEALLLAGVAAALGALLAVGALALAALALARSGSVAVGGWVAAPELAGVAVAAVGVAIVAALVPAWRAARLDIHRTLSEG